MYPPSTMSSDRSLCDILLVIWRKNSFLLPIGDWSGSTLYCAVDETLWAKRSLMEGYLRSIAKATKGSLGISGSFLSISHFPAAYKKERMR